MNRSLAMLEKLDGEVIVVSALAIDPIVGRDHVIGIERGDDIIDHIFLRKAQLAGMHAIDVEPQGWVIHVLRNIDLANAMDLPKASRQVLRHAVNLMQVWAADLHVDRSRHAHVEDGIDHRAAAEERADLWKLRSHCLLHTIHVFETADLVRLIQRHLDRRGVGTGIGGVERGEVRHDANIGDNSFEIGRSYVLPDQIFNLGDVFIRHLDASARRYFEIDGELTGIGLREESQAE